ncbi:sister chromatid cohesion protein PDS5 homolog A-A-like [Cydia strobilella]|uniref:sister chromatid cohesion protein PDS5 homolog A-A-like n=1 Tax=Cydia strobilella TaxID=1100964 RepID=UPI0030067D49
MAEIVYPQGCRPITDDLGPDELVRRLKALAHTLQGLGQDEGMYQQYIPLAIHLADEFFLANPSRDVQLLIACCIADVLRVYAPEAPYKDQEQVKTIFLFLINQLQGLRDPKDPAFKRYFYLLENLAYVKSFNMCFELEDCQEIFCALFSLMFKIVNTEHSSKVKSFMLDVLCPLITESDVVSNELLNVILMNLVEPNKRERKHAYALAKELISKTSETLEPYIQAFFNHVLILGKEEKTLLIFSKVYELIYELNQCCPSILIAVLPQLECKLKSAQFQERLSAVALLARMFSEPGSGLAKQYPALWRAFLGRFNDIAVPIRIKCVQYCMHFLVHHPDLRKDITETLKMRQHDAHEQVRYEVVMAIIATAQRDFQAVAESEDLLHFVRERTLDKKFKIRKEAMSGLAMIYRKFLTEESVPPATEKAVQWIKDKILHGYYMTALEDRLLVERLLNTSLVPYWTLQRNKYTIRMKKLYYLMSNVDANATKAFIELQKHQLAVRRTVAEWVELHRKPPTPAVQKELIAKVLHISSKFLPESVKAQEFLNKFSAHMKQAPELLQGMEMILNPNVSCEVCFRTTSNVLKKLGQPVMTNLYYNTVKMLLERVSSVMIDHEALLILVGYVEGACRGSDDSIAEECGTTQKVAAERGLKLLVMLSFVFPSHFLHSDVLERLTALLEHEDESVAPHILAALTFLGKYRPLSEACPSLFPRLTSLCKAYAEVGTPKQAKNAVRCLFVNVPEQRSAIFTEILETLKGTLTPHSEHYRTAIVTLGHIAHNLPETFPLHIKNIVSRKIVKELLLVVRLGGGGPRAPDDEWCACAEEELPEETRSRCKLEGLKCIEGGGGPRAPDDEWCACAEEELPEETRSRCKLEGLKCIEGGGGPRAPDDEWCACTEEELPEETRSRCKLEGLKCIEGGGGPRAPDDEWCACTEEELPEETRSRCKLEGLKCIEGGGGPRAPDDEWCACTEEELPEETRSRCKLEGLKCIEGGGGPRAPDDEWCACTEEELPEETRSRCKLEGLKCIEGGGGPRAPDDEWCACTEEELPEETRSRCKLEGLKCIEGGGGPRAPDDEWCACTEEELPEETRSRCKLEGLKCIEGGGGPRAPDDEWCACTEEELPEETRSRCKLEGLKCIEGGGGPRAPDEATTSGWRRASRARRGDDEWCACAEEELPEETRSRCKLEGLKCIEGGGGPRAPDDEWCACAEEELPEETRSRCKLEGLKCIEGGGGPRAPDDEWCACAEEELPEETRSRCKLEGLKCIEGGGGPRAPDDEWCACAEEELPEETRSRCKLEGLKCIEGGGGPRAPDDEWCACAEEELPEETRSRCKLEGLKCIEGGGGPREMTLPYFFPQSQQTRSTSSHNADLML